MWMLSGTSPSYSETWDLQGCATVMALTRRLPAASCQNRSPGPGLPSGWLQRPRMQAARVEGQVARPVLAGSLLVYMPLSPFLLAETLAGQGQSHSGTAAPEPC